MSGGAGLPVVASSSGVSTSPRVAALDGLRGLAVAAVVLFHTRSSPLAGGYLGVDVFFVLSGFLITGLLLAEANRDRRISLGQFWLRRARRLAPALLLLLLAVAVFRLVQPQQTGASLRAEILAALTYTTNWLQILQGNDYFAQFGPESPLLHTWSLAIEEQFYILFALLMVWAVVRRRLAHRSLLLLLTVLTVCSVATMVWASAAGNITWAYYGTLPRLQALLIGAMLAVVLRDRPDLAKGRSGQVVAGWIGLAGLAILMAAPFGDMFRGGYTLAALLTACLVWSALGSGPVASILAWRPLALLGVISYGVYLWHWPILLWVQGEDPVPVGAQAWAIVLTIGIAVVSYRFVEAPIRRGRFTLLPWQRQMGVYAAFAAVVAGLAMLPARTVSAASDDPDWPAASSVPYRMVTNGDSTMLELTLKFPHDVYADRFVPGSTKLGCGLSALPYAAGGHVENFEDCKTWPSEWQSLTADTQPEVVIIGVSAWDAFDRVIDAELCLPAIQASILLIRKPCNRV